jgi:AcrR family transcriptional regulator
MSGNFIAGKMDPRIRRTRERLGDALIELMRTKPFDAITVQDVLDRAGVGRSTFYEHFRDKNDLFLSDNDEFFEAMAMHLSRSKEPSERVVPVRELFAHVGEQRWLLDSLLESGRLHDVMDLFQAHLARGIDARLAGMERAKELTPQRRAAYSHALAGALLSMLSWWLKSETRETPERIDELYHQLVWSGIRTA